jgi:hypothetical protein
MKAFGLTLEFKSRVISNDPFCVRFPEGVVDKDVDLKFVTSLLATSAQG